VNIDPDVFSAQLDDIGMVMVGQTETLVPADRRIYALRDASGTVPSVPLIASSIMSKKLAEDLDGLLLDVKVGGGAFMKTTADATELATTMVGIGASHGTPVTAILTNMDQPLGEAVGNANEVQESIAVLRGDGPPDVTELTVVFAAEMLMLAGEENIEIARSRALEAIDSGRAFETMVRVTEAQGGDPSYVEHPERLETAPYEHVVEAAKDGWVSSCDAFAIGTAAVRLGAGRATKEDEIDPGVGFSIRAKIGDPIMRGEPLAIVSYRDRNRLESALGTANDAWSISDEPVSAPELVLETLR